jgi:signal transduction histidine kinase/CheY-like chemotaxis protein
MNGTLIVSIPAGPQGLSECQWELQLARARIQQLEGQVARLEGSMHAQSTAPAQAQIAQRQAQKMEAIGQLTGGLAHDFNNMLTGVIGSLELLRRRIAHGRIQDLDTLIDQGLSSANRAAGLTQRLLAYSRRQALSAQPTQLNTMIAHMGDLLTHSLTPAITLTIEQAPQLWLAMVDPHQVENALLNLVLNARDAMPSGGLLRLQTRNRAINGDRANTFGQLPDGDYVVLSVTDSGSGMSQSVVDRAFDPFFTTKPVGQGSGLGLSMVYGFCKQSQGEAIIDSAPGKGTTVSLFLPRAPLAGIAQPPARRPRPARAQPGESVLIVEDDPAVRHLLRSVLEEHGYQCVVAIDADSAREVVRSPARIDLLITDVGLPGIDGRQLAHQARDLRPSLKVLFITGYADHVAISDGNFEPGMELITKPFPFELLLAKVHEMISRITP